MHAIALSRFIDEASARVIVYGRGQRNASEEIVAEVRALHRISVGAAMHRRAKVTRRRRRITAPGIYRPVCIDHQVRFLDCRGSPIWRTFIWGTFTRRGRQRRHQCQG
jgi:hypothetical protein